MLTAARAGLAPPTVNARQLAAIRVAIGAVAFLKGLSLLARNWGIGLDPTAPTEFPAWLVPAALAWLALSAVLVAGRRPRLVAGLLAALGTFLLFAEGGLLYKNHFYLLVLLLFYVSLSDCGRHFVLGPRATEDLDAPEHEVPGWPLVLFRAQASIVYLATALAKVNEDFVSGLVLHEQFTQAYLPLPLPAAVVAAPEFLVTLSLAVVALEVFVALGLWSRRLRPAAIGVGLPLHLGMVFVAGWPVQLYEIVLFAAMMFTLYLASLEVPARARLVVWDDSCSFCRRWVAAFRRLDALGALRFAGLSEPARYAGTGVSPSAAMEAMHLVEPDGTTRRGYGAVCGILAVLPGGHLLAPLMRLPGIRHAGDRVYARVAARRTCRYQPRAAA